MGIPFIWELGAHVHSRAEGKAEHVLHSLCVLSACAVHEQNREPGWGAAGTQGATQQLQYPTPLWVYQ